MLARGSLFSFSNCAKPRENWLRLFRSAFIDHQAGQLNLIFGNKSQGADFLADLSVCSNWDRATARSPAALGVPPTNDHGGGTVLIGAIRRWVSVDGLLRQQMGFLNSALSEL